MSSWKRYRIGEFVLETGDRTLQVNGTVHTLAPKEFELLMLLIEHRGEVLAKEEILERIWPDSHVTEGNLSQYVYRLRSILGSESIRTIPKRGYLLVTGADQEAQESPRTGKAVPQRPVWRLWTIAGVGLGVLIVAAFWPRQRFRPGPEAYDLFLRGQQRLQASLEARQGVRTAEERRAAILLFRRAVELEPRYADAYGALSEAQCQASGRGLESDGILRDAEASARKALALDAQNLRARTALVCIAHSRGRQADSLRIALEILRMNEASGGSAFAAGEAFLRAGLAKRAIAPLRKAVAMAPEVLQYREELAYALMLGGHPGDCVAALSPALKKEVGGYWQASP
jgi:DNA-binding winged helix-turn-helix (wHTH) protein